MKLNRFTVTFEKQDMNYLKNTGIFKAAREVKKHYKEHKVPFINDTYQLAHLLGVSRKTLFDLSRSPALHYDTTLLKKKNGGFRVVNAPDDDLKAVQRRINRKILSHIDVSPFATAYIRGKQIKDNAEPHVGHKYLLKMDITDFFGSITYLQVISSAFNSKVYPVQIGAMLTSLCCLGDMLPQGAPTSPMLSNIVMKNFDTVLGNWCKKRDITYTRYCDDLTFSADIPLYDVYLKASDMLCRFGFEVNESKTKFVTNSTCQRVTGLTVNEKVSIPREYKRQLRSELYYAVRFGLADSLLKENRTEFIKWGRPDICSYYYHLMGKAHYLFQVEPQNRTFDELYSRLKTTFYNEMKNTRCT